MIINLALIFFIIIRAGSREVEGWARNPRPLEVHILGTPPISIPDTLILNDFERPNDLTNMYRQGGEFEKKLSEQYVSHGATSLRISGPAIENIELATVHFPKEWQAYKALEIDLYNASDTAASVWIRMGNRYDERRFYISSQKYAGDFLLRPGWNTVSIPLRDIEAAFGSIPDRKSLHFNLPPGGSGLFYMDYLRLVRNDSSDK